MPEIETVNEHEYKVVVDDVVADESLTADEGWANMAVQWIVTDKTVGAQHHVLGITVFPPGAKHHPHRHPGAEEAQYLIKGSGIARVGDKDVVQNTGDVVFVPQDEWHGFENTSDGETVMVWTYGGASSLDQAGYVRQDEQQA
jgi:quercetin dioxygenase-like cupin family protein